MAFYVKIAIVFEGNSFLKIKTPLSSNKSLLAKKYFFIETKYQKLKMNENNQEKINPWKQKISCKCTVSPKYTQLPQKIVPLHGYHTSRNQMSWGCVASSGYCPLHCNYGEQGVHDLTLLLLTVQCLSTPQNLHIYVNALWLGCCSLAWFIWFNYIKKLGKLCFYLWYFAHNCDLHPAILNFGTFLDIFYQKTSLLPHWWNSLTPSLPAWLTQHVTQFAVCEPTWCTQFLKIGEW